MPILRRPKADPEQVAAVLRRLGTLRPSTEAGGWVPPGPGGGAVPLEPPPSGEAAADAAARSPSADGSFAGRVTAPFRGSLLDPGRRGAAVLAVLALAATVGGAWFFLQAAPESSAAPSPASATATAASVGRTAAPTKAGAPIDVASGWPMASASAADLVVDVVGKVATPGVVTVPAGARVRDAITAAGGVLPGTDLTALNLASKLVDGEQIFVGIPPPNGAAAQSAGGVVGGVPTGGSTGSSAPEVVDLNAATQAELQTLPGVGPVLAQRIIDWRVQHGRFASVTQLQQVVGIGPSKYASLVGRVRV